MQVSDLRKRLEALEDGGYGGHEVRTDSGNSDVTSLSIVPPFDPDLCSGYILVEVVKVA